MKLHRIMVGALGLAMGTAAHGQEGVAQAARLIVGTWQPAASSATDACSQSRTKQVWTFAADGTFRREEDGLVVAGQWQLAEEGYELRLSWKADRKGAPQRQTLQIVALDGKRLELLTPTLVEHGIVIRQEQFGAFFHS